MKIKKQNSYFPQQVTENMGGEAYPVDHKKKSSSLFIKLKGDFDTFCQEKKFKPEIKKVLDNIDEYLDFLDKYHYLVFIFKWKEKINSSGCDPLKTLTDLTKDFNSLSENGITCPCEIPGCSYEMGWEKIEKIQLIISSIREIKKMKETFDSYNNDNNVRINFSMKMRYLVDVIYTNSGLDYLAKYLFLKAVNTVYNFLRCDPEFKDVLEIISSNFGINSNDNAVYIIRVNLKPCYIEKIQEEIRRIRIGVNSITLKNIEKITSAYSREHINAYVPPEVNKIIGSYANFFNRKEGFGSKVGQSANIASNFTL